MSLVNSTIDEYVLASFALPQTAPASATTRSSSSSFAPPTTSVQYPHALRQDGRLVVATPGVGVSIYDLADQTPLSSITVGPSFDPTTSAVARSVALTSSESIRVKSSRQTWVGVKTQDGTGEIWCWHEDERKDGSSESEAGKAVWPISEPLAALAVPKTLPSHLAFLSASGSFALAPANDLTSLVSLPYDSSTRTPSSQTLRIVPVSSTNAPAFLSHELAALLPAASSSLQSHVAIVVRTFVTTASPVDRTATTLSSSSSLAEIGKKKFKKTHRPSAASVIEQAESPTATTRDVVENEIEVLLLDPDVRDEDDSGVVKPGVVSLGTVVVEADQVVVSDDGFVTALSADGTLSSWRLSVLGGAPAADSYSRIFFPPTLNDDNDVTSRRRVSLSPVKSVTLSLSTVVPEQATLLALRSSFVLVAAPRAAATGAAPTVSLTYWDTRFGAVIARSDLSVPSAVATTIDTLSISACLPNRNTAIVTLAPCRCSSSSSGPAGSRMALFCLPLSPPLPSASVLAAIVGRQRLTSEYVNAAESTLNDSSSSSSSIVARAKRAEPISSSSSSSSVDAGRVARASILERLDEVLAPLKQQQRDANGSTASVVERAIDEAHVAWDEFVRSERHRTWTVEEPTVVKRRKEVAQRTVDEIKARWTTTGRLAVLGGPDTTTDLEDHGRWKRVKRVVERAIVDAGSSVELEGGEQDDDEASWRSVVVQDGGELDGVVDARDRERYATERGRVEAEIKRLRREANEPIKEADRPEPQLPSSFVTAVLRLCFPISLEAPSTEITTTTTTTTATAPPPSTLAGTSSSLRHPTSIVSYLVQRDLVGEHQLEGGLTRHLARAGDWSNVMLALEHVPDVPESTAVSLLVSVVRLSSSSSAVPSVRSFLAAFLRQRFTASTLRRAIRDQVTATEALAVLVECDVLLAAASSDSSSLVSSSKSKTNDNQVVAAQQVVQLVESILDAHFVTLLLEQRSHKLLRRLSNRVRLLTTRVDDLSTLVGALSVFSRQQQKHELEDNNKKSREEQRRRRNKNVKQFGESMERRSRAQEKHQQVGAYQVEEFYL